MTLGSDGAGNAIINVIPSLPIHSSALIALISGLFLAALILRAQHMPRHTSAPDHRESHRRRRRRARRRAIMTVTPPGAAARTSGTPLRIHWGRLGLALLGVLSLLGLIVTGILAPLTSAVTFVAPLICLGLLVAAVAALRAAAVMKHSQRRRSRVERAFVEAMNPALPQPGPVRANATPPQPALEGRGAMHPTAAQHQPAEPFNALSHDERGAGGPASLQTVDVDGIPEGVGETLPDVSAPEVGYQVATPGSEATGEEWEPRDVPKPRYLTAAKADRTVAEPLEAEPVRPSPEVRLRQPAAPPLSPSAATPSQAVDGESRPAPLSSSNAEASGDPGRTAARAQTSLDLDEVLKRRRA